MKAHNSSHSTDTVGNSHRGNIHNSLQPQFQPIPERQNLAPKQKPIRLPPMQLRQPFCSSLFYLPMILTLVTWILILFDNHAINHHVVACANVVDADRDTDFDSRSYDIFIEYPATPSRIGDGFTKAIANWSAGLSEDNCTPRSVFRDCPVGFGRGRCGGLGDLSPCKRGDNCQRHAN